MGYVRVRYELQEIGRPDLADALAGFLERIRRDTPMRAAGSRIRAE